jgi:hypothetical protein
VASGPALQSGKLGDCALPATTKVKNNSKGTYIMLVGYFSFLNVLSKENAAFYTKCYK